MSQRTRRLGERIKEIVAEGLMEMKDPRIGFVTVTDVRVSTDVTHAQVFYTVLPDDDATRAQTGEGLESAVPALRRELGRRLSTRNTPALTFTDDPVPEHGRRIEELIADTRRSDGRQRAGEEHVTDATGATEATDATDVERGSDAGEG
jgi:ribosome-binding factor A